MTPRLPLPDCTATLLFRALVDRIQADKDVKSVVKTFKSWTDEPADRADIFAVGVMPAVELYPGGGPDNYATPDTMIVDLFVDVILTTAGLRIDNCQNLWAALVRSFRPKDDVVAANAFRNRLVGLGAETGLVRVTRPAFCSKPDAANAAYFVASGQIAVCYFAK
jgi:hypothetical protein